jgi:phosphoribosylanthranilate isomerase
MTAVKICGINSAEAFDAAVDAGADWAGFVFFPRSPRYVTPDQAASLSARSVGGPRRVGLFVSPADADIAAALGELPLDILQVYDAPERLAAIAARFGLPVWQPVAAGGALPLDAGAAAAVLVEPPPPAGATRPGGNAVALDWTSLRGWKPAFPWLLAGGLTPDNVARAIAESGAPAVDVSSGVETAPGAKSARLIRQFVVAARGSAL